MAQQIDAVPEAKTSIDSLLELLKERGKLDLGTISLTLGISPSIVEQWAKVLEEGKLIRVSYEVGKMYLEIVGEETATAGPGMAKSSEMKTEVQRSALMNEMETEKITLDKYSRNLEDLSSVVLNMEDIYRKKLPDIHKMLVELDNISAPMIKKAKEIDQTRQAADSYFSGLDKKLESTYTKINMLDSPATDRSLKQKEAALRSALTRADAAKAALMDLEDTKQEIYNKVSSEIDAQVNKYKMDFKASLERLYTSLKVDSDEANLVDKQIKTELVRAARLAAEAERLRKQSDASKAEMAKSHDKYLAQYKKMEADIFRISGTFTEHYEKAQGQITSLKSVMGEATKVYDSIGAMKARLGEIRGSIDSSRLSIQTAIEDLRTINTLKGLTPEQKEKAISELLKRLVNTKVKGDLIKRDLKGASSSIKGQTIGQGPS